MVSKALSKLAVCSINAFACIAILLSGKYRRRLVDADVMEQFLY